MAVLGLILLIVSTAVKFSSYDAFAYIGGIILLLGLSLIFLWYNFTIPYDLTGSEKQSITNKKSIKSMKSINRPRSRNSIEPDNSSQKQKKLSKHGDNIELKNQSSQNEMKKGVENPAFKVEKSETTEDEVIIKIKRGIVNNAYVVNT